MSKEGLHSLYGELANKPVEAIRIICRSRLTAQETFYSSEVLQKSASDCRRLAKDIAQLGGSERCVRRAKKIANVYEYYADKPTKVESIVNKKYATMYKQTEQEVATTDFMDEQLMCPYEESGNKRSCWTCHLPKIVWNAMEREYQKDTFGE